MRRIAARIRAVTAYRGNCGIPLDTNLAGLRSVTIWSERFSVSYGAAALS
jgi:hypothetical protein